MRISRTTRGGAAYLRYGGRVEFDHSAVIAAYQVAGALKVLAAGAAALEAQLITVDVWPRAASGRIRSAGTDSGLSGVRQAGVQLPGGAETGPPVQLVRTECRADSRT